MRFCTNFKSITEDYMHIYIVSIVFHGQNMRTIIVYGTPVIKGQF